MKKRAAPEGNTAQDKQGKGDDSGAEDDRLKEFEKQHEYVEDQGDLSKIQTAEEIGQRKMVKIKRRVKPTPTDDPNEKKDKTT